MIYDPEIKTDQFIVMPNHVHGIIVIVHGITIIVGAATGGGWGWGWCG